ncbi:MAG: serine O-acetyltransferase [Methylobacter sp.]
MFEHIRADILRVHRSNETLRTIDVLRSFYINYGLQALVIYRFGRWLNDLHKRSGFGRAIAALLYPVYWILSAAARKAYGIDLDQSADIAPGFYINHFGGIEVRNCRIGPHCVIQQQAKLGSDEAAEEGPVIGAGVWIGAHSRTYAKVNVGDGAAIGVGAVVTQDIPQRCLVLGNPGRIAQRGYDNSALL